MKISRYGLYVLFLLASVATGIVLGRVYLDIYFQLSSLLFAFGAWLIPTVFLVGIQETIGYYREAFVDQQISKKAKAYFQGMSVYLVATGFVGLLIGIINMMSNLASPEQVGESMAFSLLSLLYHLIWALLVSIPFYAFGKKQEAEA